MYSGLKFFALSALAGLTFANSFEDWQNAALTK
jgi:hypothetical protein